MNAIPKTEIIKTCNDFAQVFLDQLRHMAGDYDEMKLVSTPLSKNKLEESGEREIKILPCEGHCTIETISLKDFLSNIKAEAELTTLSSCKDYRS